MPGRKVRNARPAPPASGRGQRSVASPAGRVPFRKGDIPTIVERDGAEKEAPLPFPISEETRDQLLAMCAQRFKQQSIDTDSCNRRFIHRAAHVAAVARDALRTKGKALSAPLEPALVASTSTDKTLRSNSDEARSIRRTIKGYLAGIEEIEKRAGAFSDPLVPKVALLHIRDAKRYLKAAYADLFPLVLNGRGAPRSAYGEALWKGATLALYREDPDWPRPGSRSEEGDATRLRPTRAPDRALSRLLHSAIQDEIESELRCDLPDQRRHAYSAKEWHAIKRNPPVWNHDSGRKDAEE